LILRAAASIAFVTYATWAAAESAIAGVNGTSPIAGQARPLVVQFADGRPKRDNVATGEAAVGAKRAMQDAAPPPQKRPNTNMGMDTVRLFMLLLASHC
jgi:hypothetical protein